MKRRADAALVVVIGLSGAACHGAVTPSLPRASMSHDGPVAVGTRLALGTSWRGECEEFGFRYEGSNQPRTTACRHVEHDVTIACDILVVRRGDERAHLGLLVGRVADDDALDRWLEQLEEPVVDAALDQNAASGAAVLPRILKHRVRRGRRCLLEVRIREHDIGALAAEF